jgi:hypothetical protein
MKIITNAPILLKGKNGDEQYSQGTQNGYAEGDANYSDYIFTQKESGYYSIEGELYHFDGQENTFSSVEGFVPISVAGNSIISENSDDFFNAEGDVEQVYLGADGEEYYSADGETFYNAKGEKIKGAFKKVGKGIGGGAKKVGKGIGKGAKAVGGGFKKAGQWIGKQFKKFVGKLKPKSKDARALKKLERGKKRTDKKANKKLTKETEAIYKKEKAEFDRKVKERDLLEKKNAEEKAKGLNPPPLPPPPIPPIIPTDDSGTPSAGAEKYVDVLPPVVDGEKTLPDGSKVAVPNDQTAQGNDGKTYDKKDLEGTGDTQVITNEETGEKELVKVIDAKDVTTLPTEDGEGVPFKSTDVSEGGEKKGMSKGLKIGLIVGGSLIVLGIVAYLIYRSKNQGKAVAKGK